MCCVNIIFQPISQSINNHLGFIEFSSTSSKPRRRKYYNLIYFKMFGYH